MEVTPQTTVFDRSTNGLTISNGTEQPDDQFQDDFVLGERSYFHYDSDNIQAYYEQRSNITVISRNVDFILDLSPNQKFYIDDFSSFVLNDRFFGLYEEGYQEADSSGDIVERTGSGFIFEYDLDWIAVTSSDPSVDLGVAVPEPPLLLLLLCGIIGLGITRYLPAIKSRLNS